MKLIKNIPKKFLKLKKSRSVSRSDDPSFSSNASSDSSQKQGESGLVTPTSVLASHEIVPAWAFDNTHDFVHAFRLIDADNDGKITKEELESLLRRVAVSVGADPLTEEEITSMMSEVDRDGDGCISLEEFSVIGSVFGPPACDDELKCTFEFFDADHDGKISAEELYNVFRAIVGDARCTLEECRRMISHVDRNRDGFVCFEDFSLMMEQQLSS